MPADRRFLIPVFWLILIIGGGCPPAQPFITPPSMAVAKRVYVADGADHVAAYGIAPLAREWECKVPHGNILGVGKYVWVGSFSVFHRFMVYEAGNPRLLALDPATGRGVRSRAGEVLAANERFIVMRDGRIFEVDTLEQAGKLAMDRNELASLTSSYCFAMAGDRFTDTAPRSGARLSLARQYELPSGKLRWDFQVAHDEIGPKLVGVEGDVVAVAEVRAEAGDGAALRVLGVRGFEAREKRELWRGDEAVRALVAARRYEWPGTYLPRTFGVRAGQLVPMVTEAETLDIGTGVIERHEMPGFVERMRAENKVEDPRGGVASMPIEFYEVDTFIVAVRVDRQRAAFVECYLRDGTRQWQVAFTPAAMGWEYRMRYPRNDWGLPPLYRDGAGHVITFSVKGPVVIEVGTGKHQAE